MYPLLHRPHILALILSMLPVHCVFSQTVLVQGTYAEGQAVKSNYAAQHYMNEGRRMRYYGLEATWRAKGATDSINVYDQLWGRPEVGGGLMVGDFSHIPLFATSKLEHPDYKSTIGQMVTFYTTFRRDLLRTSHWSLGYKMENGVGVCTKPFDLHTNLQNIIIGSPLTVYVGMGFFAQYRPTRHWSIGLDGAFRHYSNGRLTQPNAGVNTLDVGLRVGYILRPDTLNHSPFSRPKDHTWKRHLYADFNLSWSPQTIYGQFEADRLLPPEERAEHYQLYSGVALRGAMMYHYRRKFASGLALDYTYVPYINEFRKADLACGHDATGRYSRHVVGIGIAHEAFWHDFSIAMSVGYYLFRHQGVTETSFEKPYFETVGLRYYLPMSQRRLYVGYNIKASAVHASGMQFGVGFCPWK